VKRASKVLVEEEEISAEERGREEKISVKRKREGRVAATTNRRLDFMSSS
jgi:hypothetical protein